MSEVRACQQGMDGVIREEVYRTWVDENTGRDVRQLTNDPKGAGTSYFRCSKHLPGGRVMGSLSSLGTRVALDPETGRVERLDAPPGFTKLRESDGRFWRWDGPDNSPWTHESTASQFSLDDRLPDEMPGNIVDVTCDGRKLILQAIHTDNEADTHFRGDNAEEIWRFLERPRHGGLWAYDLFDKTMTTLVELEGIGPIHPDASPTDPAVVKFSHDRYDGYCQRIWTVRTDGSGLTPIRPQERGEVVTHEFWWPDGSLIGYKYQDRRNDPTIRENPWAEYAPVATRFGLSGLDGREVFLSDPLNSYHSHIFVSMDGTLLCGEGTDGNSFAHAARIDLGDTRVDFVPLATIHTKYHPFAGQGVRTCFTGDNRWLVYNDTIEGRHQVCAVRVDI